MIKITGGKFKSKKLETISQFVRPTSSLKREAFFSIIESYKLNDSNNSYEKKIFIDMFAGIGTMGLEAISRGFNRAIFYENNQEVIRVLEKNCKKLCNNGQYEIIHDDLLSSNFMISFDEISIIYIDPPYNRYNIDKLLIILQNRINKNTIIGVESSIKDSISFPEKLKLIKQKKYGKTNLSILVLA